MNNQYELWLDCKDGLTNGSWHDDLSYRGKDYVELVAKLINDDKNCNTIARVHPPREPS